MYRLYIRKGTTNRRWIPVGYFCDVCSKMFRKMDLMEKSEISSILIDPEELAEYVKKPKAVVIDMGSCFTKVGVAGESKPRFVFDTALYYDNTGKTFIRRANFQETTKKTAKLLKFFQNHTNIEETIDLDIFELFLTHVFNELKIKPSHLPVLFINHLLDDMSLEYLKGNTELISDSSLPPNAKKLLLAEKPIKYVNHSQRLHALWKKLILVLFDRLHISKLCLSFEEILSLYANKSVTGVIVNLGNQNTRIIPIYNGFIISHATNFRSTGGKDVIDEIKKEVLNQGKSMGRTIEKQDIIEKNIRITSEELCYVSIDSKKEDKHHYPSDKLIRYFKIIDDEFVSLKEARYTATEVLFQNEPLSITKEPATLAETVVESIQKCNQEIAKDLYSNIILTGGASMYEGFLERFTRDLRRVAPQNAEINVILSIDSANSGWIGGAILASIDSLYSRKFWITKEEYNEKGSSIVEHCF